MKRALAALVLLAGCGDGVGPAEEMSFADARTNLLRSAGNGSAAAFCSTDGRIEFRRAVRSYMAAAEAEHVELGPMQVSQSDEAVGLVMVGLLAKIVRPSDLRGEYRSMATMMNVQGSVTGLGDAREALAKACPEMVTVYREVAVMLRMQSRTDDMEDMSVRDRQRLSARMASQQGRVQRAMERLDAKMRAEGWNGETPGMP